MEELFHRRASKGQREWVAKHVLSCVLSARPVCKTFHYIDGAIVRAPPMPGLLAGLAIVALTAVTAGGLVRARK